MSINVLFAALAERWANYEPVLHAAFDEAGLDYVSCSPFRVPIARLAAAQALRQETKVAGKDHLKQTKAANNNYCMQF